jgi:hypothetical protein
VVLLTAEDGLADTVRPRLELAGADLERVIALPVVGAGPDQRPPMLPDDLPSIRAAMDRAAARLVIIDPLMAFLAGGVDSHRDQDVRRVLAAVAQLAEETAAAVVIVRHLNKTATGNPLYRGGGSIGIVGAARSGLLVARDPDHDDVRILASTKSNLCAAPASIGFVLDDIAGVPRLRWTGESPQTAVSLLAQRETSTSPRDDAREFLLELLSDGPLPSKEVQRQAKEAGVSWRTVRRTSDALQVQKHRHGPPGQSGAYWTWSLPDPQGGQPDPYVGQPDPYVGQQTKSGQHRENHSHKTSYDSDLAYVGQIPRVGQDSAEGGQVRQRDGDPGPEGGNGGNDGIEV